MIIRNYIGCSTCMFTSADNRSQTSDHSLQSTGSQRSTAHLIELQMVFSLVRAEKVGRGLSTVDKY
jgi:hypothetical protein